MTQTIHRHGSVEINISADNGGFTKINVALSVKLSAVTDAEALASGLRSINLTILCPSFISMFKPLALLVDECNLIKTVSGNYPSAGGTLARYVSLFSPLSEVSLCVRVCALKYSPLSFLSLFCGAYKVTFLFQASRLSHRSQLEEQSLLIKHAGKVGAGELAVLVTSKIEPITKRASPPLVSDGVLDTHTASDAPLSFSNTLQSRSLIYVSVPYMLIQQSHCSRLQRACEVFLKAHDSGTHP